MVIESCWLFNFHFCYLCSTTISTGSTFHSPELINYWTLLCIAACRKKLRVTWSTLAHHFRNSPAGDYYAPLVDTTLLCRRYQLSTFGRLRAFSVAGPTSWNSLPDRLRDPTMSSGSFWENYLKRRIICALLSTLSAVEMLHDSALYKFTIDIDVDSGEDFAILIGRHVAVSVWCDMRRCWWRTQCKCIEVAIRGDNCHRKARTRLSCSSQPRNTVAIGESVLHNLYRGSVASHFPLSLPLISPVLLPSSHSHDLLCIVYIRCFSQDPRHFVNPAAECVQSVEWKNVRSKEVFDKTLTYNGSARCVARWRSG